MKLVDPSQDEDRLGLALGDPVTVGSAVEVRRRFDRHWAHGFEVVDVDDEGYWLRRSSDGAAIPVAFPPRDIRPAAGR